MSLNGRELSVTKTSKSTSAIGKRIRQHPTHTSLSPMILRFPKADSRDELQTPHSCHSDMGLSFPKPDSRDVLQTTSCSHSILIYEWQHTNGMRTVIQHPA